MICKICGAQIPDGSEKCEFCGADFNKGNTMKIQKPISGETDSEIFDDNEKRRREQMDKMLRDKQQQLSEIEKRRAEKRQRQRRNRILLIALISALGVGAAGLCVYYVTQNIIETGNNPSPTATPSASVNSLASVTQPPMPSPSVTPELSINGTDNSGAAAAADSAQASGGQSRSSTDNTGSGSSANKTGSSSASVSSPGGNTSVSGNSQSSSGISSSGQASTVTVVNSGISSDKITAKLGTGGNVIRDAETGKLLMTFVTGGKRYYANVSEGSATEQIQNKTYTFTAEPTSQTYNGNTIYEITDLTNYDGTDYIIPDSGTKLLTQDDINGLSKYNLALARNEIYARHGRKFQTEEYNKYFSQKSWYQINPNYNYSDDDSNLNEIEIKNVAFILAAEKK